MAEVVSRGSSDAGSTKLKTLLKKISTATKAIMRPPADNTPPPPTTAPNAVMPISSHNEGPRKRPDLTSAEKLAEITIDEDKLLTFQDLQTISHNFCSENYLGRTQFGVLYKGFIPEGWKGGMRSGEVTIKLWKNEEFIHEDCIRPHSPAIVKHRMAQEINFLQQPDIAAHPYTVNVLGYCLEDNNLGVVYDLKPLRTLKECSIREDFGWLKRVDVAVKLACVLKFFHERVPEYVVRNLCPAHVMLDQDLNPILIDYALLQGGSYFELLTRQYGGPYGVKGYISFNELECGDTSKFNDVHAYGAILLEMMRKLTYKNNRPVDHVVWHDYSGYVEKMIKANSAIVYSFAHESFRNDPDYYALDGFQMSIMGLRCIQKLEDKVLTMDDVVEELKDLKVVRRHPQLLDGIHIVCP